jgi:hypothetical protein
MSSTAHTRRNLLLGAICGLLALVAGVALADVFLPEWRAGRPLDRRIYGERYQTLVERSGLALRPGEPQLLLVTRAPRDLEPYRSLGDKGTEWLLATRTALRVEAFQEIWNPAERRALDLAVDFSLDGRTEAVSWWSRDLLESYTAGFPVDESPLARALAPQLLAPGETLGVRRMSLVSTLPRVLYEIRDGNRPQHLFSSMMGYRNGRIERQPGALTGAAAERADALLLGMATLFWRVLPGFLALVGLFLILTLQSRIGFANAVVLSLAALVSLLPNLSMGSQWGFGLMVAAGQTLWIFLLWCCAESLLRSTAVDFTTSLDALRAGRLGPRGGRALLVGFGFGAALAGLRLGLLSLAEILPGVWPSRFSIDLPLFRHFGSPVADGIRLAGGVALALALAMRVLPIRWAPLAAAIVAGLLLKPVPIDPFLAGLAANAAVGGLLVWICRRYGLTALLSACVLSLLLPAAILAGRYLDWMPGSFAAVAALSAAAPLLGLLGMSRSATAEVQRLTPPVFVRRLEEERRFRHEMELLARMQRALLPRTLPPIAGYELAAQSIIANEAGGDLYDVLTDGEGYVWIAAGDVAGHGYSCAVAQAMTKAALGSLVGRGRSPAEVLQRADRVLRAAGAARNFTSLALLRLRPETGEALLSNAGHPYPLLVAGGQVTELAISALPLGLGPPRRYEDRAIRMLPGSALVFFSDGLFEAADGAGRIYGFDRLGELLRDADGRTADKLLEMLLADWRRHLRAALPLDDTTVLVLRRREERAG